MLNKGRLWAGDENQPKECYELLSLKWDRRHPHNIIEEECVNCLHTDCEKQCGSSETPLHEYYY